MLLVTSLVERYLMNLNSIKNTFKGKSKTQFQENRLVSRQLGADSMVLLKNKGILPLKRGKVALFGAGAVDTIYCGNYTNYVFTDGNVSVRDGLAEAGFSFSTTTWLQKMEKQVKRANKEDETLSKIERNEFGVRIHPDEVSISEADIAESIIGTDVCIYVIRRDTRESENESYYSLTKTESDNLKVISNTFENIVLVINSSPLEVAGIARMKNVKAIVYMGIPGMEAGNSLADILTGAVNPNGRLSFTWAKKYKDYPTFSKRNLKFNNGVCEVDFKEGIYVGYRYFDSYDVAPLYPFGYGMSYTTFSFEATYFEANWINMLLRVNVTNIGEHSGREVVQLYVSSPDGRLSKPYQELKSFVKTGKLKPNETEEITLKVPIMSLCSFDDDRNAWVLEGGDYIFRVGHDSKDTKVVAKMVLDQTVNIKTIVNVMNPTKEMSFMSPPPRAKEETGFIMVASLSAKGYNSQKKIIPLKKEVETYVFEGSKYTSTVNKNDKEWPFKTREKIEYIKPTPNMTFFDVVYGRYSVEEFVTTLSPQVLARIVCGATDESLYPVDSRFKSQIKTNKRNRKGCLHTTSQYEKMLGIPSVEICYGASGIHLSQIEATSFPSPMNMAQTWDMDAMVRQGRAYGREMEQLGIDYCLAPDLNINRMPMQGRAYECYSEDPALAGVMGAGFTIGVKRYDGRNVIMKHLVCQTKENENVVMNYNIGKRAFAEIYLRPFSICQYIVKPAGIMNSAHMINGKFASNQRGMNTDIIRTDWGWEGFVMTDIGTASDKGMDIHGGCDLILPGYDPDRILEAMIEAPPTFTEDGYVQRVNKGFVFGVPTIRYDCWGSFVPDKDGTETLKTEVPCDMQLNPIIPSLIDEGICTVKLRDDGIQEVEYKGYNRGAYLCLGDLQQAAIHILTEIKNSASMQRLMDEIEK